LAKRRDESANRKVWGARSKARLGVVQCLVGWETALALSGIEKKVVPHTLRHAAATWLMQQGVDAWEGG
jgi:site-specific recombinase XerD